MISDSKRISWEPIIAWKYGQVFKVVISATYNCMSSISTIFMTSEWVDIPGSNVAMWAESYTWRYSISRFKLWFSTCGKTDYILCGFEAVCLAFSSGTITTHYLPLPKSPKLSTSSDKDGQHKLDRLPGPTAIYCFSTSAGRQRVQRTKSYFNIW